MAIPTAVWVCFHHKIDSMLYWFISFIPFSFRTLSSLAGSYHLADSSKQAPVCCRPCFFSDGENVSLLPSHPSHTLTGEDALGSHVKWASLASVLCPLTADAALSESEVNRCSPFRGWLIRSARMLADLCLDFPSSEPKPGRGFASAGPHQSFVEPCSKLFPWALSVLDSLQEWECHLEKRQIPWVCFAHVSASCSPAFWCWPPLLYLPGFSPLQLHW